ncbi:MAG TPA: tRNA (adenosine(37)-N6)-threonylcarbamoyltransferase complex dimerization subunit type 1 TsaB [Nevskiaceae bacterium]|nr:tRNA (adenosine(37)-N6)-threonylcarbamoyltransferase complex dimerization subunit type 1 TsaB [Nevskiaceae bacterium]
MKLLAIDTATEACSVALHLDGVVSERFVNAGRSHTELLLPMVRGLMADAGIAFGQLDGIACGIGPGSFAGVRIGVGYVKGAALAADLPVVGISSLAMLAQGAIAQGHARVLPVIDAKTNEIYAGLYERDAQGLARAVMPDLVCLPAELPATEGECHGCGSGWGTYGEILRTRARVTASDAAAQPHASAALALALPEFAAGRGIGADELVPAYLRNKVALTLLEQADLRRRNKG